MEPFVSVINYEGKPSVKVTIGTKHRTYPLTKSGCLQAGRELFEARAESWMNSSSVDYPEVVKPGWKLDVHELIGQGFQEAEDIAEAPRKSLVDKMIKWCQDDYFQDTLTKEEKLVFTKLTESIYENEAV